MQRTNPKRAVHKRQTQKRPGLEYRMRPHPDYEPHFPGSGRLLHKKCIITGGDSGIGRAVAVAFAKEGADVAIVYLKSEEQDARDTARIIKEDFEKNCLLIPADISREKACSKAIKQITEYFSHIDVLVNNAGVQYPEKDIRDITDKHLFDTFAVNLFAMFWTTQAALPLMKEGSCIVNTTSVTAYRGSAELIDYSATKGAIVSFTRSLAANLAAKKIRVNAVAPGPVWTPLIVSSFDAKKVSTFGTDCPMKRPAQPAEIAPAYVFLASEDASFITGQVIHVNGGEIVNG